MVAPEVMRLLRHACSGAATAVAQDNRFGVAVAPFAHHLALLPLREVAQLLANEHRGFEISVHAFIHSSAS